MEKHEELVSEIKGSRQTERLPHQYIAQEIESDISVFPDEVQPIITKWLENEHMTHKEQSQGDLAIDKWWQNKYGFPYNNKAARNEVIMRKYASQQEIEEAHTLQDRLLDAYQAKNEDEIAAIKQEYQKTYPDQLEGIEVVFGLENVLKDSDILQSREGHRLPSGERRKIYQNFTEYNFLLTHFIHENRNDKPFLEKMWAVLEAISKRHGNRALNEMHMLQSGIVTQAATIRLFEEAGMNPKLSHPAEDAFHAVDLWVDTSAVQIKGSGKKSEDAVFFATDTIAFPGIEISREERKKQAEVYHINSDFFGEAEKFQAKLSKYGEMTNKKIKGYFLVVPHNKIDFITGEPAPEFVKLVKERIKTELT